jgi:hypothetical protein
VNIISWNVKSFASCIQNQANAFTAFRTILLTFDLMVMYEVPNSANGNTRLAELVTAMNPAPPAAAVYQSFAEPSGGLGNENDQVAIIWNRNTTTVVNRTAARRGANFAGGRAPVYFNITEIATGNIREGCAWHAPAPGGPASALIAQGWQSILQNAQDHNRNPLTHIVMGDFNSNFADPSVGSRRKPGNFLRKQINGGATTLRSPVYGSPPNVESYRSQSLYDQFYVDTGAGQLVVNRVGIYDVLNRLVNNAAPLTALFGNQYNSARRAYDFYYPNLSDHLPVAIDVTL